MKTPTIIYQDELPHHYRQEVTDGLNEHAYQKKKIGKNNGSFAFIMHDNSTLLAAVEGYNYYGCLEIDLLFVKQELRHKGLGSMLMQKCEVLAKERACHFMVLYTMDFEARPFYEKHGFTVEFVREGFEGESVMYCMRKNL